MVGFFGRSPAARQSCIAHITSEYVREAFPKYKITYVSLVPLVLKNLHKRLQTRFRWVATGETEDFQRPCGINKALRKAGRGPHQPPAPQSSDEAFGGGTPCHLVAEHLQNRRPLQFF